MCILQTCVFLHWYWYFAIRQTGRRGRHRKVVKPLCNSKLAMILLSLQLCPPPLWMWWAAWRGVWLPAKMVPSSFPPHCGSHRGQLCTRKNIPPSLLSQQSLVPSSPALYHSRRKFYQVSCDLPANERPVRLSNGTLSEFICRHIPLHWRSLVSSDSCAKKVADLSQFSLWDNFGILSGKCWVSCDLT